MPGGHLLNHVSQEKLFREQILTAAGTVHGREEVVGKRVTIGIYQPGHERGFAKAGRGGHDEVAGRRRLR